MTPPAAGAYSLVVASAALHAYWNFLLKRSGGGPVFVGLSKVVEVALFAPVFAYAARGYGESPAFRAAGMTWLIVVGAVLTLANYAALAVAYREGDLCVVYPVSRAASLLLVVPLGFLMFRERPDATGFAGLALVGLGVHAITGGAKAGRSLRPDGDGRVAIVYAIAAGAATAGYTVWDKHAVGRIPAFIYFYAYTALVALAYAAFVASRVSRREIVHEWTAHRAAIVQVGVCNTVAYVLLLVALRSATSSYVVGLRQVSIVFGAAFGAWRLHEELSIRTRAGMLVLLTGCVLLAVAHA